MPDAVRELYSQHRYPALSHAETDPSLIAVSARCGGHPGPAQPSECRVLEIGCASGHNLLPLAARYPDSEFVGFDFSDTAIRAARAATSAAGLENVSFEHADLREWSREGERFDYIIAHGMLSWVPDEAKEALFRLIPAHLDTDGVACLSYNTLPGGALRREAARLLPVVEKLTPAGTGPGGLLDEMADLCGGIDTPHAKHLASIYGDLRRKLGGILDFDERGPVCDSFHFAEVIDRTANAGLRYLGESSLVENLPPGLPPEILPRLQPLHHDGVAFQQTLDLLSGRTHRTSLFCGESRNEPVSTSVVLEGSARLLEPSLPPEALPGELVEVFHAGLTAASPSARSVRRLMEDCASRLGSRWEPGRAARDIAGWLFQAARLGWVELRADETSIEPVPADRPCLSALNRHFAAQRQPLVDAFHRSLGFPERHWPVVAALDGSRTRSELAEFSAATAPDLHFDPWLVHLASRGLFG